MQWRLGERAARPAALSCRRSDGKKSRATLRRPDGRYLRAGVPSRHALVIRIQGWRCMLSIESLRTIHARGLRSIRNATSQTVVPADRCDRKTCDHGNRRLVEILACVIKRASISENPGSRLATRRRTCAHALTDYMVRTVDPCSPNRRAENLADRRRSM